MTWRNKNGSLNLSIQAIVILVMAMAVLGLGLGFIRGLMGKGQGQFEDAISNAKLQNPASADVVVTSPHTVKVKKGGSASFEVGVYNNGATGSDSFTIYLTDPGSPDYDEDDCPVGVDEGFILNSLNQDIGIGSASGFIVSLEAASGDDSILDPSITYICTLNADVPNSEDVSPISKQIYVKVGQ